MSAVKRLAETFWKRFTVPPKNKKFSQKNWYIK